MQQSRAGQVGDAVEGFWHGTWHRCRIQKWTERGADVLWDDGTCTIGMPPAYVRRIPSDRRPAAAAAAAAPAAAAASPEQPRPASLTTGDIRTAGLTLPIGPSMLRYCALASIWLCCAGWLALIIVLGPDYPGLWWSAWAVLFVACCAQTLAESRARKLHKKLHRAATDRVGRAGKLRLQPLIEEKEFHRARTRHAMTDVVNTVREHLADCLHNWDNHVEGIKAECYDTAADTLYEDNDHVDWGGAWKRIGQTMQVPERNRSPGAPDRLQVLFGDNMRRLYFAVGPGFLNGASYGATPLPVLSAQRHWMDQAQRNPVEWRFKSLPFRLKQAEALLAHFLRSDPEDTKLLPNANAATSAILKSLPWDVGDRFLMLSVDYDATKLAARWLRRTYGVESVEIDVDCSMSDDEIVSRLEKRLREMKMRDPPLPALANFCHVTSKTAWVFPVKRLAATCRKYGVSVMIDGAQAAGHLDVDVPDIGADWYYGTVHKWMYSAPGVAFIVTQPHKQRCTFPLTVPYFDGQGYTSEFSYTGLQDFSNWLTTIDAFDFVDRVCGSWDAVRSYCRTQARECAAYLGRLWRTEAMQGSPERYGNMPIMPLPDGRGCTDADALKVMGWLSLKGITAFLLVCSWRGGQWLCVRCTCQIYTCMDDWMRLGQAVLELQGKYSGLKMIAHLGKALLT